MASAVTRELPSGVTADPRRAALNDVLQSDTFARAEQLRNFLRFVCELVIEGRESEIDEYTIGVRALGRTSDFLPREDSSVRTRAHLLRQKLVEVYEHELVDADLRIELPKGTYAPRFVRAEPKVLEVPKPQPLVARYPRRILAGTLFCGLLVGVMGTLLGGWAIGVTPQRLDGTLRQAWGPLVEPGADVVVCVSGPVHLAVRGLESEPPEWLLPLPNAPGLRGHILGIQKSWHESLLFLEPTRYSVRQGEAFALAQALRVLENAGARPKVMATSMIQAPAFIHQNMILVGSPDFDGAARRLIRRGEFSIGWDPAARDVAVQRQSSSGQQPRSFHPERDGKHRVTQSYGLISVLPSRGSAEGSHRTVVISGLSSAGTHGAMEYFASPYHLSELQRRFEAEGVKGFPPAFQVVVRCASSDDRLVSYDYAAHKVLDPASLQL